MKTLTKTNEGETLSHKTHILIHLSTSFGQLPHSGKRFVHTKMF